MMVRWAVFAGLILGAIYTLSPLTVLSLAAMTAMTWWVGKDLAGRERRWFFTIVAIAIAVRVVAVAGLFLTADPSRPFAVFFGDEEIFKSRPLWLRNIGLGVPISAADFIYALDETGMSAHLYVLAFVQALVGDAPYGVHLFNVAASIASVLLLYRLIRPTLGRHVAMGGLILLLAIPSLFAWSVSALKEPIYNLVAAVQLGAAVAIVRAPRGWQRAVAAALVIVLSPALEALRKGSMFVAAFGTAVGITAGWTVRRPRWLLAAIVVLPIVGAAALSQPSIQDRLRTVGRQAARYHTGHVVTPGVTYEIIDPRYYTDWGAINSMPDRELLIFATRAVASYFVEPSPANLESPFIWAYLPEHFLWLVLVVLMPIGIAQGLRRDAMLTCVLVAHACASMLIVALNSGNIGTLIRHRELTLPYTVWLSALGAFSVIEWLYHRALGTEGKPVHAHS